ncbi:MAG: UDP binding domain-containing protein, partial [Pseudomonadota bacterium]
YYLKPGFAYGGSCLPKEVRAVAHIAASAGVSLPLIEQLEASNRAQIAEAMRLVRESGARRVAVLGLAFKPGTDDLRESPTLELIAALRDAGIEVSAHDPAVTAQTNIEGQLSYVKHGAPGLAALATDLADLIANDAVAACLGAEAVIVTQKNDTYAALAKAALDEGTPVVDVVRAFDRLP